MSMTKIPLASYCISCMFRNVCIITFTYTYILTAAKGCPTGNPRHSKWHLSKPNESMVPNTILVIGSCSNAHLSSIKKPDRNCMCIYLHVSIYIYIYVYAYIQLQIHHLQNIPPHYTILVSWLHQVKPNLWKLDRHAPKPDPQGARN